MELPERTQTLAGDKESKGFLMQEKRFGRKESDVGFKPCL